MERFHASIGSRYAALQQRPEVLKTVCVYAAIHVLSGMIYNLVRVIGCESFIREQGISVECCASFDMLAYFRLQCAPAAIRYNHGAKFPAALHNPHGCGFILPASSGDPALTFAQVHIACFPADEGFIYFYFAAIAAEFAPEEFILQGQTNAMQHEPSGLLRQSQIAGNFIATDSVLAIGEHPCSSEPLVQSDRRILIDGSDFDGELALWVMAAALPQAAIWIELYLFGTAGRADDAFGPASHSKVVNAVIGIREVKNGFLETLWFVAHGVHHARTIAYLRG